MIVIDFIAQLSCLAHLIGLQLNSAFYTGLLASALQAIHDLIVMLKVPPELKSLLIRTQETVMILNLAPMLMDLGNKILDK